MASSFFGLHVASSGLNAAHASINTTANNISNVNTKGYSRQKVNLVAASALRSYQKYGSTGTGVSTESVTQTRDSYYDRKYWENQSSLGLFTKKLYYMEQIETYFTDGTLSTTTTSASGFSTIYSAMFNALDNLKTSAGDSAKRNEFLSKAQELSTYFNSTATRLQELQSSINDEIKSTVDNVNAICKKVSLMNKQINIIEMEGGHANELRDQRALLIDELAEIFPIQVEEREVSNSNFKDMKTGATYFTVKVNGQLLIDNYEYQPLTCVAREEKYHQSDIEGLYDVVWKNTLSTFDATASTMSGSLKAMFEVRDGNNNAALNGAVTDATGQSITISRPTVTDINKLNIPEMGSIMVNSTEYTYHSFTCETDETGAIVSYTFELDQLLTTDVQQQVMGRNLEVGKSVNYMGVPYYMSQMNEFLRSFCKAFNDFEKSGVDLEGNPGESMFVAWDGFAGAEKKFMDELTATATGGTITGTTFGELSDTYYRLTALNVRVSSDMTKNPKKFVAASSVEGDMVDQYDIISKLQQLESKTELFRGGGGNTFLQCIYADVTVDTQESSIFKDNYANICQTITNQRLSVSGVDEDEEALDLMKFQNAYNLASKCISVFQEMYDRLITQTGV